MSTLRGGVGWFGGLVVWMAAAAAPARGLLKGPYLQDVRPGRVTVMWETAEAFRGVVEFGPTPALGSSRGETLPRRVHKVTLIGLKPGTRYYYRVRGGGVVSTRARFTTAFLGSRPFTFAVYGDTRGNPGVHARVIALIRSWNPDFVVHTGDFVNDGRDYRGWQEEFFNPAQPLMRSVCLWPVLGNHEYHAGLYFAYFSTPPPGRWYAFRWGSAEFIVLDSTDDLSPGSRQWRWLRRRLASYRAGWRFVFLHYPPQEGIYRDESLMGLFERYGVDVVFAGHRHRYERTFPLRGGRRDDGRGVVYVTTGGGGAPLYTSLAPQPRTAKVAVVHHACLVRINGGELRFEAREVGGRLIDSFIRRKELKSINPTAPTTSQPSRPAPLRTTAEP